MKLSDKKILKKNFAAIICLLCFILMLIVTPSIFSAQDESDKIGLTGQDIPTKFRGKRVEISFLPEEKFKKVVRKADSLLREIQLKLKADNVSKIQYEWCKPGDEEFPFFMTCEEHALPSAIFSKVIDLISELKYKRTFLYYSGFSTQVYNVFNESKRGEEIVFVLKNGEKMKIPFFPEGVKMDYGEPSEDSIYEIDYDFVYFAPNYSELVKEIDEQCKPVNLAE